jgi:hypothetical protein
VPAQTSEVEKGLICELARAPIGLVIFSSAFDLWCLEFVIVVVRFLRPHLDMGVFFHVSFLLVATWG